MEFERTLPDTGEVLSGRAEDVNLDGYDFIDFGASKGASIDLGIKRLGGTKGIGIDINPKKVERMLKAGYDCIEGDVTRLDFSPGSVRFVIMSHLLEHLPDLPTVRKAIVSAASVASDFLYIQGPSFDADEFLESQGLKFYWSDWRGHPCHLTTSQLREILLDLGLDDFVLMVRSPITNSFEPSIHPLSSPRDQHGYDPDRHPEKPFVTFPEPLYRDFVCCVRLRPFDGWQSVVEAREGGLRLEAGADRDMASDLEVAAKRSQPPGRAPQQQVERRDRQPIDERPDTVLDPNDATHFDDITKRLMLARRWSYLRFLHLREGLVDAKGVESVLAVGCGRGHAEVALALEFPEIRFHLTDIESQRTPQYENARRLVEAWELENVTFGVRDILTPERDRYDLVASVEVLEHIENDALAAAEMRAAANKYVFTLVPFADKAANRDEARRARVYEKFGRYRVGYDEEDLRRLFPGVVAVRGCYWKKLGGAYRARLQDMSDEEIEADLSALREEASTDLVDAVPKVNSEAQGIWMLAEV